MKTDTQLRSDVEAELKWDPSLDERGIIVGARNGVVTLAGQVPSYADKWTAERVAKRIASVHAIANELEVKPTVIRTDQEIAVSALDALKSSVSVPPGVTVVVRSGWLTLEGKAAFWFQKNAAEIAVRSLWGVRGISNEIQIEPQPDAANIRSEIHAAFERHAAVEADKIGVNVLDGVVTLSGHVHSWHEREDAENAVWAVRGVTGVNNNLSLAP